MLSTRSSTKFRASLPRHLLRLGLWEKWVRCLLEMRAGEIGTERGEHALLCAAFASTLPDWIDLRTSDMLPRLACWSRCCSVSSTGV